MLPVFAIWSESPRHDPFLTKPVNPRRATKTMSELRDNSPMNQSINLDDLRSIPVSNYLGETPVWSTAEQCLYWINCEKESELHRWSPQTGARETWLMPERIGGVVLKRDGGALVVLASGLYDFDCAASKLQLRVASPLPAHVKLHECACDRQGRLWVGAYDHSFSAQNRNPGGGFYFRLEGDRLIPEISGINVANGLAFSPDGKTLYAADSPSRKVFAYDLDPITGKLSNGREFLTLPTGVGFIDGATVDRDGGYWLSLMYGNALHRYLPDGTLDQIVRLPFSNPTKAVFGGTSLDTLFVTTTQMRVGPDTPADFEMNGPLYYFQSEFKGLEDTPLRD